MQGIEHGTTGKMVKGTNGVNGEDRGSEARLRRGGTEQSAHSLCADAGAEAVLVWHAKRPAGAARSAALAPGRL